MKIDEVDVGDLVKNGRSAAWGKVVKIEADPITGNVRRIRVRRSMGGGFHQSEPTWWDGASIVMVERVTP